MRLLNYAFPTNVRTVLSGLCYGVVLIALLFYPFPQILDKAQINPPQWVIGVLIAVLVVGALWLAYAGKLRQRNRGIVGWSGIGMTIYGAILAIAFHDRTGTGALIAGIALLVIHTSGCIWALRGSKAK